MSYQKEKTRELIKQGKIAVDIMLESLEQEFDFKEDDTADSSKLKSFIESKEKAFNSAKEMIKDIAKLEEDLKNGNLDLEVKEFTENPLESRASKVK